MSDSHTDLPDSDQIVRYVGKQNILEDGTADGSAFLLRTNRPDETGLSVHWLEVLQGNRLEQLAAVRRLSRIQFRINGRLAELNVGNVRAEISNEMSGVRIVHKPLEAEGEFDADHSHSEIAYLPPGDSELAMLIGDLIAGCVIVMHPALNSGQE